MGMNEQKNSIFYQFKKRIEVDDPRITQYKMDVEWNVEGEPFFTF